MSPWVAPAAWDLSTGLGINVAVVDTGYRLHPDLGGNVRPGYDFISDAFISNDGDGRDVDPLDAGDAVTAGQCGPDKPARDSSWHGTHVAGTIAATTNNGVGVAGVAFNARVVPVRVLGRCGGFVSDVVDGIARAAGLPVNGAPGNPYPAKVINLSLGAPGPCPAEGQDVIDRVRAKGAVVVVVSAGNSLMESTPANCGGVISVAATTRAGGRAPYSNTSLSVDVAAPGGDTSVGLPMACSRP